MWLPYLPIERLTRRARLSHEPAKALALVEKVSNIRQVTALNPAALTAGLRTGMPVADAQNVHPDLQTMDHDKKADARFLKRLGLWGLQFSPLVMQHTPDSLAFNISGCAHLFGNEQAMAEHCQTEFKARGLTTRIALADTMGAARAMAKCGDALLSIIPPGQTAHMQALAPLPIQALAPDHATYANLKSVGLTSIGDLKRASRSALRRRYERDLLAAYDQALGYLAEPFEPLLPPATYREMRQCVEPLVSFGDLCEAANRLCAPLARQLEQAGLGATRLRLMFFRVDGQVVWFEVRMGSTSHDHMHFARLLHDRLRQFEKNIEAGFGFDRTILEAVETAPFEHAQQDTEDSHQRADTCANPAITALADRLRARFGDHAVQRFHPRASHWPERSCKLGADNGQDQDWSGHVAIRPLTLFDPPQAIKAIAEVPHAPPVRFFWRRQTFEIAYAEGPERIAPEWWLVPEAIRKAGPEVIGRFKSRDYYRVEDEAGHRFWLFRRGLYEDGFAPTNSNEPQWFVHGLFG